MTSDERWSRRCDALPEPEPEEKAEERAGWALMFEVRGFGLLLLSFGFRGA